MERGSVWRPNSVEMSPSCPRCGSSNTKFCYYNNYSLTQPRYFCKGCRRYWTKGGSLRNVPVGGGCRKSRRPKSSTNGNNGKNNLTSRYNNGVDSGGSNCGGGPNIDLALVYANFLNPKKPDSSKNDCQLPNGSDQNSVDFVVNTHNSSSLAVDPSSGELLIQVENPNCCPAWSTEIIDHHHHNCHYHHHHHHPQMLFAGFEEISDKNQERLQEYCNYGLPPLPGQELVCVSNQEVISGNFVLSEPPLMENHIIAPAPVVQAPVVHLGDESEDPTNLLFGGWSPFDFSTVG